MQTTREIDSLGVLLQMQSCLVVEASPETRLQIHNALVTWGAAASKVISASKCEEAAALLATHRPTILILDIDSELDEAIALLAKFEDLHPETKRVALVYATSGTTPLKMNGLVDGNLEIPVDIPTLRKVLLRSITTKFYPDTFMRKVLKGDEYAKVREFDKAAAEYNSACTLNADAQRAFSGLAFLNLSSGNKTAALDYFKKARGCSTLDFKTFTAEFETQLSLGDFTSAVRLIPAISSAAPMSSASLKRFVAVSMLAKSFEELPALANQNSGYLEVIVGELARNGLTEEADKLKNLRPNIETTR